jgi:alpha-N-arabinofuranosidase
MYAAHQGAQSLRALLSASLISYPRNTGNGTLPGLFCSASLNEKRLTLTVANPSLDQTRETDIRLRGGSIGSINAVVLAAADIHAHNTFENPRAVEPRQAQVSGSGSALTHAFPPASVTKLEFSLS